MLHPNQARKRTVGAQYIVPNSVALAITPQSVSREPILGMKFMACPKYRLAR